MAKATAEMKIEGFRLGFLNGLKVAAMVMAPDEEGVYYGDGWKEKLRELDSTIMMIEAFEAR